MTVQSVRIARERDRADREAEKAQAVNAFLLRVLGEANPRTGKGTQTTILEGVDAAAPEIDEILSDDPEVRASVQTVIGRTYGELGRDEEARALLESALRLRRETLGDHHMRNSDYDEARALHEEGLALDRELRGEESDAVYSDLHNLGVLAEFRGDLEAALSLYSKALQHSQAKGLVNVNVSTNLSNVGWVLYEQGNYVSAERRFRESASMLEEVYTQPNQTSAHSWAEHAMGLVPLERHAEAADLFAKAFELDPDLASAFSETDPDRLTMRSQRGAQMASAYGRLLAERNRYDEAESLLLAVLHVLERDLRPDDPRTRRTRAFLAELYEAWGRSEKDAE